MKKLLFGLVISVAALWWAFHGVEWQAFWSALSQARIGIYLLGTVVLLAAIPLRGYRWGIFLEPIKRVPTRLTSAATLVGYFGNNALPFRLGEILRSYYLAREARVPTSQVFGTVIVERLVDGVSLLIILAILPIIDTIPEGLHEPVKWGVIVSLVVGGFAIWLALWKEIPLVSGRVKVLGENLRLGFTSLRHTRHYVPLVVLSTVIWVLYFFSLHITQYALGLGLTWQQSYIVLVTTSLVAIIPAAPGLVGTYHAAVILALVNFFGIDLAVSQAAAVVLHLLGFIPYTILGFALYVRSHLHLRDMRGISLTSESEAKP